MEKIHSLNHAEQNVVYLNRSQADLTMDKGVVPHAVRPLETITSPSLPSKPADGSPSRAFASIGKGIQSAGHLCAPGGKMCFMKGRISTEELREVRKPFNLLRCERLHVPGCAAERHLIELQKSA